MKLTGNRGGMDKVSSLLLAFYFDREALRGRELFCRLALLIPLRRVFDLDLQAEGAGGEKDEL